MGRDSTVATNGGGSLQVGSGSMTTKAISLELDTFEALDLAASARECIGRLCHDALLSRLFSFHRRGFYYPFD